MNKMTKGLGALVLAAGMTTATGCAESIKSYRYDAYKTQVVTENSIQTINDGTIYLWQYGKTAYVDIDFDGIRKNAHPDGMVDAVCTYNFARVKETKTEVLYEPGYLTNCTAIIDAQSKDVLFKIIPAGPIAIRGTSSANSYQTEFDKLMNSLTVDKPWRELQLELKR